MLDSLVNDLLAACGQGGTTRRRRKTRRTHSAHSAPRRRSTRPRGRATSRRRRY